MRLMVGVEVRLPVPSKVMTGSETVRGLVPPMLAVMFQVLVAVLVNTNWASWLVPRLS